MQPEPSVPQAAAPVTPPAKKSSNALWIVLVIVLILAVAGVGFWGYQQSAALKATQGALTTLQGKYDSLTAEKNTLSSNLDATTAELGTTKAELEKTKADLATTQGDLKTAQDKSAALEKTIEKARKYAGIIKGIWVDEDSFSDLGIKVNATDDAALKSKFEAFDDSRSASDFGALLEYLYTIMVDVLK